MSVLIGGRSVKTIFQKRDPSRSSFQNVSALVQSIRKGHPGGVNMVLIGAAQANAVKIVEERGIIAVLIGMLLPAVQKVSTANNVDARQLETTLKPGSPLGFIMSDGTVHSAAGRRITDCEGYTFLTHEIL